MTNPVNLSFSEKLRTIAYFIVSTNTSSTSKVQRKFGYYYNTCSQAIDILEKLGVVSEIDTINLNRKILVSSIEELEEKLDFYF